MSHRLVSRRRRASPQLALVRTLAIGLAVLTTACAPTAPPAAPAQPQQAAPKTETAPAPAAKQATLPPIRVVAGTSTTWTTHLTVLVAMAEGYFKEAGLESVEWSKAGNDGLALGVLMADKGDVAVSMTTDTVVKLVEKGENLAIIGSTSNKLPHIIFGQKGMATVADLKGKTIATDTLASTVDGYVEKGLARHGMPISDVTLVRVGNSAERFKALDGGVVNAALIGPSEQPRAVAGGYPQLMNVGELFEEYLQRTYVVNGKFLQDNPQAVDAYMLAMVRAHDFLHKPENMDRLWQVVQAQSYDIDPSFFKASVQAQVALMPRNALPSAQGLQIVLDEVKGEAPSVTADRLLRLDSVRKAIEKTGIKAS